MKILKYLSFLLIGFILFFFIMGLVKPTITYGHKIEVNKSLQEAWAVQQDATKFDQWLDGFKSIDLISGELGKVGSTYKVVVNPGDGQPDFEMIETVESLKEFDHIRLTFDSEMMDFDQTTSFAEVNGKTTIKTDSKVTGKGIMWRSVFAVMDLFTDSFQKKEIENIENLKKVIEKNTTDYYPAPVPVEIVE